MIGHIWEFWKFDHERFFKDMALEVTGLKNWEAYAPDPNTGKSVRTGEIKGLSVVAVICYDGNGYKLTNKELEQGLTEYTNKLHQVTFHLANVKVSDSPVKMGDKIAGDGFADQGGYFRPVITKCVPYSPSGNNFLSELSIEVSEFQFIKSKK